MPLEMGVPMPPPGFIVGVRYKRCKAVCLQLFGAPVVQGSFLTIVAIPSSGYWD